MKIKENSFRYRLLNSHRISFDSSRPSKTEKDISIIKFRFLLIKNLLALIIFLAIPVLIAYFEYFAINWILDLEETTFKLLLSMGLCFIGIVIITFISASFCVEMNYISEKMINRLKYVFFTTNEENKVTFYKE